MLNDVYPNLGSFIYFVLLTLSFKQFSQYWHNLINQVKHEVGKKHRRETTYNKPNIRTLIKMPFKYLMIIPPCNYLVNHLFLLVYPQTTRMANMMMTIICTGMPNMGYQSLYLCNASNCYYDSKNNPSYCHFILVRFDDSRYSHA